MEKNNIWLIILVIALFGYGFLLTALYVFLFCIAFGLHFTWGAALVTWLIANVVIAIAKVASNL